MLPRLSNRCYLPELPCVLIKPSHRNLSCWNWYIASFITLSLRLCSLTPSSIHTSISQIIHPTTSPSQSSIDPFIHLTAPRTFSACTQPWTRSCISWGQSRTWFRLDKPSRAGDSWASSRACRWGSARRSVGRRRSPRPDLGKAWLLLFLVTRWEKEECKMISFDNLKARVHDDLSS